MVARISKSRIKQQPAAFSTEEIYPLPVLAQRGLGKHAIRIAREQGLPVRYIGRCGFVLGRDLEQFLLNNARTVYQPGTQSESPDAPAQQPAEAGAA